MLKSRRTGVPNMIVAVSVPAIIMVSCPVAGRVSPAFSIADLHCSTGHAPGDRHCIAARGTSVSNISFHRNEYGSIMVYEPS